MIGRTISHYHILEELGRGGMGVVYKARDTKLDRTVALKFLPSDLVRDEDIRKRFEHEAKAAAALDHPNICTIFEIGSTDDQTFIAMAFIEGQTLKERIHSGPLEIDEALSVAIQVVKGLGAAHAKGIVHRDIKPANIMVTPEGQARIMDFGVAKSARLTTTAADTTLGTVAYMSPEQARGEAVDYRTDIWSLGVVLYEMVTGQKPFKGDYEQAIIYAILNEEPLPPMALRKEVPSGLDRIILKAMGKDLNRRYSSTREMLRDLQALKDRMDAPPPSVRLRREGWRRWIPFLVALVMIVAIGVAGMVVLRAGRSSAPSGDSRAIRSIAVLPLENLSGDPDQEYFVDGMTEALITELSKIKALRVISRTSAMQYKNVRKSLPVIARELGVDAVVEGSAMRAGGQVRITAQLIEAGSDHHLWAESYERELRNIISLQREVAQAIAGEVRVTLTPSEQARLATARAVDPEAYEAYLKGRYYWNKRTEDDLLRSIEFFERAVDEDPDYALAYAGLADAYIVLGQWTFYATAEAASRARTMATRALELDDNLAEAHAALAAVYFAFEWSWDKAEQEFKRAIELNPNYATAHQWYAEYLTALRRHDEALAQIKLAAELDPLSLIISFVRGMVHQCDRDYEEAIKQYRKIFELDADFYAANYYISECYLYGGMHAEAVEELLVAMSKDPTARVDTADVRRIYRESGLNGLLRWVADQGRVRLHEPFDGPYYIALSYSALGDKNEAFEWLEKAYETRQYRMVWLKTDAGLDSLRSDPRFTELVRRVGFPE